MPRELMPSRRRSENIEVKWNGMPISVTVGYYGDGRPGEIFIDPWVKRGSEIDIAARDLGLVFSMALQHGCALQTIKYGVTNDSLAGCVIAAVEELTKEYDTVPL